MLIEFDDAWDAITEFAAEHPDVLRVDSLLKLLRSVCPFEEKEGVEE